jgi:hypothetical protein
MKKSIQSFTRFQYQNTKIEFIIPTVYWCADWPASILVASARKFWRLLGKDEIAGSTKGLSLLVPADLD